MGRTLLSSFFDMVTFFERATDLLFQRSVLFASNTRTLILQFEVVWTTCGPDQRPEISHFENIELIGLLNHRGPQLSTKPPLFIFTLT